jgi:hypothetical protein
MPLQKILFRAGINRENTRYTTEGGWYEGNKVRFRQGLPESIGGWVPFSLNTFRGACRSIWNWVTLVGQNLLGIGTNLKFYINQGGTFNDVTPIRRTATLGSNPFTANGTTTVTVTDASHGASTGDFVTFSGATGTYATTLNAEYQITVLTANTYTITTSSALVASSYGGAAVVAAYQISVGPDIAVPLTGWGASIWGSGPWGIGSPSATTTVIRLWSQQSYGQDLVFGPRNGGIYYWKPNGSTYDRGITLNTPVNTATFTVVSPTVVTLTISLTEGTAVQFAATGGTLPTGVSAATTYYLFNVNGLTANLLTSAGSLVNVTGAGTGTPYISLLVDCPTVQNGIFVSAVNRFVFAVGTNDYGSSALDPMLVRWSDQDNVYVWTPDATNQAGSLRLSHGSEIVAEVQTRQEILLFTDSSVFSMQYVGPPIVWASQLLGDGTSIAGPNAAVIASGIVYWMGIDKFYSYDGRLDTLKCDVRRYVFDDFNTSQRAQVYCSTNEGFNEVWWFYCSASSNYIDRYVVYNYQDKVWYYGTLSRTAWLDSGLQSRPLATTYNSTTQTGRIISHENGLNDNTDGTDAAINAYIGSSEFDLQDGHNFGFVWRIIPDLTFSNSTNSPTAQAPQITMTLIGLYNSGSDAVDTASGTVVRGSTYVVTEAFTGQIYTRIRGRQMIFKIESNQINTAWQLGAPRIDIRNDGRR